MPTVTKITFDGVDALELRTPALRLVAVTAWGPRIAFLGRPDDANLLLWKPRQYQRGEWDLRGGHRVWVTRPGADECEDTYAADNAPCDVELLADGFRVTGGVNPANRTRRGFAVTRISDHAVRIDNFVTNAGDLLYSGGVWALTCTLPGRGTQYGIPIGDGTEWDAFTQVMFRRWAGHGAGGYADPQFEVRKDVLAILPQGQENKRMIQSHHGIIAMTDSARKLTFAKRTPWLNGRVYPLNTNLALYIGPQNFMVEMESMGPEQTLRPGETLHHVETWVLREGAVALDSAHALVDLFA
ncbi:MAG: hypothetical protein K8T26_05660 [Lentisphaerae bacterium]|nr:hypothetical protein [Lentisphaerota bacterium]